MDYSMFLNKLFLYWKKVFTFNNFSSSSNLQFSNFSQIYLIINQIYLNYCPQIIESRKEYIVSFINENFNRHLAQKNLNLRNFLQLSKQLDCYCSFFIFQKFPLFLHWPAKFANKDRNFSFTVRFSFSHIVVILTSVCYQAAARNSLQEAHVTCIKEFSIKISNL